MYKEDELPGCCSRYGSPLDELSFSFFFLLRRSRDNLEVRGVTAQRMLANIRNLYEKDIGERVFLALPRS